MVSRYSSVIKNNPPFTRFATKWTFHTFIRHPPLSSKRGQVEIRNNSIFIVLHYTFFFLGGIFLNESGSS